MRLLNVNTLAFKEFFDSDVPPYCILSHRWSDDEITYKDFVKGRRKDSRGYQKVLAFCNSVKERELFNGVQSLSRADTPTAQNDNESPQWVWIDTVCIDKRSSQELSEAINSMYSWYLSSQECYVYLQDVPPRASTHDNVFWEAFECSDWFNRGWTLQELLAPDTLIFCDQTWAPFGYMLATNHPSPYGALPSKSGAHPGVNLHESIAKITGITGYVLNDKDWQALAPVALKLSWAAKRKTTRKEDEAYCLLGLLEINIPLLYGEGSRAFLRLQEEVIKRSSDDSIFAWNADGPESGKTGMLAPSVKEFNQCSNIFIRTRYSLGPRRAFSVTNIGLQMTTFADKLRLETRDGRSALYVLELTCWKDFPNPRRRPQVELVILECKHRLGYTRYYRSRLNDPPREERTFRSMLDPFNPMDYVKVEFCVKPTNLSKTGLAVDCKQCHEFEKDYYQAGSPVNDSKLPWEGDIDLTLVTAPGLPRGK